MNVYRKIFFLYIVAVNLFFVCVAIKYTDLALLAVSVIDVIATVCFADQTDDTPTIARV